MKVLEKFPKRAVTKGVYDAFLDGKVYELTADDFGENRNLAYLRTAMQSAGRYRGIKVRTSIVGDKLYVQAINKEGERMHG